MSVDLKSPHSILEVLRQRPKDIQKLELPKKLNTSSWRDVEALALRTKIPIQQNAPEGRATIKEKKPIEIEELYSNSAENGIWLALDCIQDVHNLGAIFRSASFFGINGILLTQERSAPMTGVVYDVASGGVEAVPFAGVKNLRRALELAKKENLWILGTSEHRGDRLQSLSLDRKWLIVMGNEETGIRPLTEENCDLLCTISQGNPSGVGSLNVSVATGILLSHFSS